MNIHIDRDTIKEVDERQKRLESLCEQFNSNINKLMGKTNSSMILSILASLSVLMEVTKDNIDFTRSGFDLFLKEIESLNKQIEYYHKLDSNKR